jgi:hypothetical protein
MLFPFLRQNIFFQNKIILANLIISLVLCLTGLVLLYFYIAPRVEPISLRYTIYFGIDLIGSWWSAFFIPLAGFILLAVNFLLAYLIFVKNKLLAYFLALASSLTQILILIISILVILLNR